MRVADQKGPTALSGARAGRSAAGAAGGARFSLASGVNSAKAEALAPASILGGLEALIALQSGESGKERRRRSVRRGQGLLDVLDELKLALLSGHLPPNMQMRLALLLREEGASGDPALDQIMDGIELRAAVELAKLKQAQAARGG